MTSAPRTLTRLLAVSGALLILTGSACTVRLPFQAWQDSQSADEVFNAGVNALGSVHSLRLVGDGEDAQGQSVHLDVSTDGKGGANGRLTIVGVTVSFVVVGTKVFLRGNAFFQRIGAPASTLSKIDDKWLDLTGGPAQLTQSFSNAADISTLKECSLKPVHGKLSKHGTSTIDGHTVVELDDEGNVPGSTKGAKYYVETDSPHFMIRLQGTRAANPGGPTRSSKCGPNDESVGNGRLDLRSINQVNGVKPPSGALNPRTLQPEG